MSDSIARREFLKDTMAASVGAAHAQDYPIIHGIRVSVQLDKKPSGITSVPEGGKVVFTYGNGRVSFEAEPLKTHSVYRIDA